MTVIDGLPLLGNEIVLITVGNIEVSGDMSIAGWFEICRDEGTNAMVLCVILDLRYRSMFEVRGVRVQ